jgi:hypothetical protein
MTSITNTTQSVHEPSGNALDFHTHYNEAARRLRTALIEAYQALGIDAQSPREAARQLGLDKNLTWKISRIVHAGSDAQIAFHVPGDAAIGKLLTALRGVGTAPEAVSNVQSAFHDYQEMVEIHTGDRASLELMLDSMDEPGVDRLEKSRKLAYQGNRGVWGIQAGVRLSSHILTPNKSNPDLLDYVQLGGYVNFQRLRPGGGWPLLRLRGFNDDGTPSAYTMVPLEEEPDPSTPLLLRDFFTGTPPPIRVRSDDRGITYDLDGGRVGRTGVFSAFYGFIDRSGLTRYRDEHNEVGQLLSIVNFPMELLISDLIVHKDLAAQFEPSVRVFGRASGGIDDHERSDERQLLPLNESLTQLRPGLPLLANARVPRYTELADLAFERAGLDRNDFTGWRLCLPYPPMPSTVSITFSLPERGS